MNPDKYHAKLKDSKLLTNRQREILFDWVLESAEDFGIAEASVEEIDQLNIHHASLLAMKRAYEQIRIIPDEALIDGKILSGITLFNSRHCGWRQIDSSHQCSLDSC